VVVCDFDVVGIALLPPEANPILIVNANTVLASSSAPENFQSVARRNRQFAKLAHAIQLRQLARNHCPECWWTGTASAPGIDPVEQIFRRSICERAYHTIYYNGCRNSPPAPPLGIVANGMNVVDRIEFGDYASARVIRRYA
jgi:hypothetical protein